MAVDKKDYPNKIDVGVWANNDYSKFLLFFSFKKKLHKKVLNYTYKTWNKKDKIKYAKAEVIKIKEEVENHTYNKKDITLDDYATEYFKRQTESKYMTTKKSYYENHLRKSKIGEMKLKDILSIHIKGILKSFIHMSERTKKTATEILNPLFKDAIEERICIYNPCDNIKFKLNSSKKIIMNAKEELKKIIEAVEHLFKKDDYYYCLFSFYIQGRRRSEVLEMKWKNIDLKNNYYIVEDVKNGENQRFHLGSNIKKRLKGILKINEYVFPSYIKRDDHLKNITLPIKKIREYTKSDFTLKDTRNIITSAMGEDGESAIYQSGTLGHKSLKTIDMYSTVNYEIGSKKASDLIKKVYQETE